MRTLTIALTFVFALAAHSRAQDEAQSNPHAAPQGHSQAGKDLSIRVKFDKDSAKGEITCRKGEVKGDKVEFERCLKYNVDKYKELAVSKHIMEAAKVPTLDEKIKGLAAKLAFLDSARVELKKNIEELKSQRESLDYKKLLGAKKKIDKEYKDSITECGHDAVGKLNCPSAPDEKE